MLKLLIPVDGSANAERVVNRVIRFLQNDCPACEIHVLNVQPPVEAWEVKRFMPEAEIEALLESRGGDALASARALLDQAKISYTPHVRIGPIAETIIAFAREIGCNHIVMGTRGMGAIGSLMLGSVATKVIHLADVPVTLVK